MAGELTISNLVGTFDYQQILSMYYQSQSLPVQLLQKQESKIDDKISALKTFEDDVNSLYSAFNDVVSTDLSQLKTVSSSSPGVLTASVVDPSKAINGAYQVQVDQLAQNDVWLSQAGVSDLDSAVATTSGQITVKYAGETVAVIDYDTDTSDSSKPSTLTEIADAINNAQDKVKASIIYDGSSYRLILSGADTGSQSTISISETGDGDLLDQLKLGDDYSDSHVQTAQDAKIEVYGATITSPTNTFEGAIPGLELTVNSVGTATLTVNNDYSKFEESLNSLVDAYNKIVDFINDKAGKDGILSGDNTLYAIRSTILSKLQPLFNLGLLSVDKDTGHLSLDDDKLSQLLQNSSQTVQDAVSQLKENLQDYLLFLISPDGPVESEINGLESTKSNLKEQIDDLNKVISDQMEALKQQLIQVQLLQAQMEEVKARLTSVFGNPSLFPE
ncbi:flagellar filament capping protein FliD [Thermovibrio sp.]